jgi:vancomycin resistance protein YoaR
MGLFVAKSLTHKVKRGVVNASSHLPIMQKGESRDFPFQLSKSISPLFTATDPRERPLLLGKIQNLRLACQQFHNRVLLPGETFSFWRHVGPPWRSRGFAFGREIREGCVIPAVGGGLCQLSGSLLEVIAPFDFELIERHRHTALPPDVSQASQRDATVFWNYVDLRFRSQKPVLFETEVMEDVLIVRLRSKIPQLPVPGSPSAVNFQTTNTTQPIQSCFVCNQTKCSRHSRGNESLDQ